MQQLSCVAPKTVEWLDVPEPTLVDGAAGVGAELVRPVAVARCESTRS
jgi:hypothetical protein